ncbi:MAG: short-chain fatty acyl-CoA regulator family protein [Pikeienuella sp.]
MGQSLVGQRIRERRRAKKLSQAALARDVGISASYLNLIEHNRRGIAGRTLIAIAARLEIDPREFSDEADAALIDSLTRAAGAASDPKPEADRVGELIGRFPGWSRLLARLYDRTTAQSQTLSLLSDRLTHDPYLAETMHLILSNITAIHATVGILDETPEMEETTRQRFIGNVYKESDRLTATARDLVKYLDGPDDTLDRTADAGAPVQSFWSAHHHHLPEVEAQPGKATQLLRTMPGVENEEDIAEARRTVTRYGRLAAHMPLNLFQEAARRLRFDPEALASEFACSVDDAMLRLTHLPPEDDETGFGMIECDAAGGVLLRKEIAGLTLPTQGGACPLWPLYRAFSRPGAPLRAVLETPTGTQMIAYAIARSDQAVGFDMPPPMRAVMIFSRDAAAFPDARTAPVVKIGAHCSVCSRKECASRRMPYILG